MGGGKGCNSRTEPSLWKAGYFRRLGGFEGRALGTIEGFRFPREPVLIPPLSSSENDRRVSARPRGFDVAPINHRDETVRLVISLRPAELRCREAIGSPPPNSDGNAGPFLIALKALVL